MDTKDSLFFSQGDESSYKYIHASKDSLDEDLNKLSLAISRKHMELTQNRTGDSQHFTLDDIVENDGKDLEIEQLKMRVEDLESFINEKLNQNNQDLTYIPKKEGFNLFQRTSFLDFSNSLDMNMGNFVECSLMDLYQLVDETSRIIRLAEADLKMLGRLSLGSFKLDVRVNKDDFLVAEKEEISQQISQFNNYPEKSRLFEDIFADNPIFYMFEGRMNEEYEKVKFLNQIVVEIGKNDLKTFDGCRSSIVNFLEFKLLQKTKMEEKAKIFELEWQTTQARSKKSSFFHKSKKVSCKEEELRKLNRNISQQTVKNAKDRERLEEDVEVFTKQKDEFLLKTTEKVEVIRKVLQEIEDAKLEEKEEPKNNRSIRPYDAPSVINEVPLDLQIKTLQEELVRLEYEYKTSTIPETLETISTNIDRVKSNLMNLQSLKVLKSTERNSSAIRNRIKMAEKNFENASDHTSSSKEMDSHKPRNLPHPFRNQNITLSPVRRLEVNTTRLDTSTLNSPSRRSPFLQKNETKEDVELKKYLRKKEQELNEREEEIENEERKVFETWTQIQDNEEIVEMIEKELVDIRKNKKDILLKNSALDREKVELNQRAKLLENKEKEFQKFAEKMKNNENEFERKKESIYQKLEWLKRKLLRFDY